MSGYSQGRQVEYDVIEDMQANGYETIRAASSKGLADVVATKPGQIAFISCKRTNPLLPPAQREALLRVARYVNAVPLVAIHPRREPLTYRRLTGVGPKEWEPWTPDEVGS